MQHASFCHAEFTGTNLAGADLLYASFSYAQLHAVSLDGIRPNWSSRELLAELLRQRAGLNVERLQFAGLVLLQRDWCWSDFRNCGAPALPWALDELAKFVRPGDASVPWALKNWIRERREVAATPA